MHLNVIQCYRPLRGGKISGSVASLERVWRGSWKSLSSLERPVMTVERIQSFSASKRNPMKKFYPYLIIVGVGAVALIAYKFLKPKLPAFITALLPF